MTTRVVELSCGRKLMFRDNKLIGELNKKLTNESEDSFNSRTIVDLEREITILSKRFEAIKDFAISNPPADSEYLNNQRSDLNMLTIGFIQARNKVNYRLVRLSPEDRLEAKKIIGTIVQ